MNTYAQLTLGYKQESKVIYSESHTSFEQRLNEAMKLGFHMHGDTIVEHHSSGYIRAYVQVMVKYVPESQAE